MSTSIQSLMSQPPKNTLEISDILFEQDQFDMSHASILLEKQEQSSKKDIVKEPGNDTANIETRCDKKSEVIVVGSFMKDLEKFQKEISYQSDVYDIYAETSGEGETYLTLVHDILAKRLRKDANVKPGDYIVDFAKPKRSKSSKKNTLTTKTVLNSPRTPKRLQQQKPTRHTDACQEYYGFGTPMSQRDYFPKKKRNIVRSSSKRSQKRIISFESKQRQSSSKGSSKGVFTKKQSIKFKKSP